MEIMNFFLLAILLFFDNFRYLLTQRHTTPPYLDGFIDRRDRQDYKQFVNKYSPQYLDGLLDRGSDYKQYANKYSAQYLEDLLDTGEYKLFANTMQIPHVDLVDPSKRTSDYFKQFYFNGLKLGDIVLRYGQVLNPENHTNLDGNFILHIGTWENGTVPYYISKNTDEFNLRDFLLKEIQQMNELINPNVVFRPYQSQDLDYVFIYCGGSGWYSNLGNVGGAQVISLPNYEFPTFLSHELQHVLGIGHENNRNDRNEYFHVKPEKINDDLLTFFVTYSYHSYTNIGPFDYYSSMGVPVFVPRSNETLMDPLRNGIDVTKIGFNGTMNPTDVKRVKTMYPLL